ncbi:MAG: hypothetical protein H0V71_11545, partial [Chloroflexi bacterium]|nr:hypothetical protein [Chloroflexota bacterium]
MSATEPVPRRILVPFLVRAGVYVGELNAGERIALAAMLATPFALYVDYRTGAALVEDLVQYQPIGEAAGRLVSYHQVFGWTQVVWLAAGAGIAAFRGTRDAFRSLPLVLLAALLALILGVTLALGGIDRTTVVALGATLLPLIAMTAVLTGPSLRQEIRRVLVTIFVSECAAIVALSFAKKALAGRA